MSIHFKGHQRFRSGFTVLELLIVLVVIGILASITLVSFKGAKERAKIAQGWQFSDSLRAALQMDMVGWWTLNRIEGGVTPDNWFGHNDGIVYGAQLVEGIVNNALSFDGNDYVSINDTSELRLGKNQTIEAWLKPTINVGDWVRIVGKGNSTYRNYGLWRQSDGDILCQIYGSGTVSCWKNGGPGDNANIPPEKWGHAVCTYDGTQVKMYVNGKNVKNCSYSGTPYTSSDPVTIGYATFHTYFKGLIDEVRIYSAAFPQSAIQKHYVEGLKRHQNLTLR